MKYRSDQTVMLGDEVQYNKQGGAIVLLEGKSTDINAFDPAQWKDSSPGMLIRFENGALLYLDNAEDPLLTLCKRATSLSS